MKAEIVAVGSEMLTPDRVDTNSLFLTEALNRKGIDVIAKSVVSDDQDLLTDVLRTAVDRADLVIVTGGLGPTADDVTREAVAQMLRVEMIEEERIVRRLEERFARRGVTMPANNRKQAQVPRGGHVIDNESGTAPGLLFELPHDKLLVCLPGPPREMKAMFERLADQRLTSPAPYAVYRRVLKSTGRSESQVDEAAHPIYSRWETGANPVRTTILATPGQIELHLSVRSSSEDDARSTLDGITSELSTALGPALFATDGSRLEEVVGRLLRQNRMRIATAESCTGGLVCSRLTDVPGSSDYVERGVVCYSNEAKVELLGVPAEMIDEHGAVSEPVGLAMARGVRELARTDIGVGITGIAGPTGGSAVKPVGTVVVALCSAHGDRVRTLWFPGDREQVKFFSSQAALDMVRRHLLELG